MPHKYNADRRHHIPRAKRWVTNWAVYNEALRLCVMVDSRSCSSVPICSQRGTSTAPSWPRDRSRKHRDRCQPRGRQARLPASHKHHQGQLRDTIGTVPALQSVENAHESTGPKAVGASILKLPSLGMPQPQLHPIFMVCPKSVNVTRLRGHESRSRTVG